MSTQYRLHITKQGERWDHISWQYYGDPYAYPQIIAANPHVNITFSLPAGLTLAIPILEKTTSSVGVPPWTR